MACGTESIPKVDKIFGPGNQYVTAAKEEAALRGVAIDMPAGPSELLVIADEKADPDFVASDLLSQAEHGADSQVVLVSDSSETIEKSIKAVREQISSLPRKEIAEKALNNDRFVQLSNLNECTAFSNVYAPEHLIINTENARSIVGSIRNAGSVFLGPYSCESAGDYASGTNHTLPTNGYARNYSGVSVDSFVRKITFQELTPQGVRSIGNTVELLAEAEGLEAHKRAMSYRLNKVINEND